ncbi:hypothetical protein [Streptomonospora arabica]|uniref:PspA/IM30 family protein n=1 Tax=Streptomonospora arabica TaxID=412417 RepID=A0ABV9SSV4_9ACTN
MSLFNLITGRESATLTASRERMRRSAQADVDRLTREIADLDAAHARSESTDHQGHRAIRRDLEANLRIARANLREA